MNCLFSNTHSRRFSRRTKLLIIVVVLSSFRFLLWENLYRWQYGYGSSGSGVDWKTLIVWTKTNVTKDRENRTKVAFNATLERPIAFVHFHKAGGTSMVNTFTKTLRLWKPSRNGNPWEYDDDDTKQGPMHIVFFWRYNRTAFAEFMLQAKKQRMQFVAMEWNFFTSLTKAQVTSELDLVTCMRDPYDRMVSNLFFEGYKSGYQDNPQEWIQQNFNWTTHYSSRPKWQDFSVNFNKPNYYTTFLNGLAEQPGAWKHLNRSHHLEIAKERLHWFREILILEHPETHTSALQRWLPPEHATLEHYNANKNYNIKETRSSVRSGGRYGDTQKQKKRIALSREEFYRDNALDKELYEYAVQLSKTNQQRR